MNDKAKLPPIIRGTDWAAHFKWQLDDASGNKVTQNWLDYELDCQFKTEQGVEKPVAVTPTLTVIGTELLQISLDELQTAKLSTGVLFFNLLATKADYTQQVVDGTIIVQAGVTTP